MNMVTLAPVLYIKNYFMQLLTDPVHLIQYGGLLILLIIIFLETGTLLGIVLPGGDYLVFTAGLLSGTQYLDVSLWVLVSTMIGAAILGDFTGYAKGRWLGGMLFNKEDNRFFKKSHLEKTRNFYQKYGMMAFITGRFMPVIRTLIPMLAGATSLPIKKFSLLNIAGAILWIGSLTPLGYYLGTAYPGIMKYSIYFLLGFILLASFPMLKILIPKRNK
ncbi:MAG: VTT domain-containing protein [Bacteroidales bacterium]|nr:VTT domain-containing protein [Bacteroidales bacterium]